MGWLLSGYAEELPPQAVIIAQIRTAAMTAIHIFFIELPSFGNSIIFRLDRNVK